LAKFDADHDNDETRNVMRETRLSLSNLNVIQGDLPASEEWLEQVLDEFPDDVGAHNDLGYLWADQGKNLPRALKMLQHAVAAEPKNGAYRDSLGWCFFKLGRYDEALVELKAATAADEDGEPDAVILDHLGDVQAKLNNKEAALEAWRRALPAFDKQHETEKSKATQKKIDEAQEQ
jgi:Tfp pilus assembly protein PilF